MVRLRRIGPPGIEAHLVEMSKILPVEVASLRIEDIVWHHATVSWPRFKRKEGIHLFQFTILICPRTETCPDGNHQMGIILVNILHHFLRTLQTRLSLCLHLLHICRKILGKGWVSHLIYIIWILELHRIPVGVASPILPVLHDGISRNLQFAILIQYASQFVAGLIALTALPEAHRPFREHRSLSGQLADAGDDSILCTILVHKIVVGTGSYFTGEGSTGRLPVVFL